MSKSVRLLVLFVVFVALALQPQTAAGATSYKLPVDGPVTDKFRPPATPYGAGNRGWEFASTPGGAVKAANDGEVTFVGQVGGTLNVVIKHPDGLLTTYSKLASITILKGMAVKAGQTIGTAAANTYFGVRRGGEYVDPAGLFGANPYLVRLEASVGALSWQKALATDLVQLHL